MPPLFWMTAAVLTGTSVAQAATVHVTVLARDGKPLPDAVVLLEPAAGQKLPAASPSVHTVTQEKMQFDPVVSVVPVGSTLRFSNLDRWDHHVHGGAAGPLSTGAVAFEFRLAGRVQGQPPATSDVALDQAGPLQLSCHLHGSMRGFVYVAATPWAAKTAASGTAVLTSVPEGAMRLRVWHPYQLLEPTPLTVQVQPVTTVSVPTAVQPPKPRRTAAEHSGSH